MFCWSTMLVVCCLGQAYSRPDATIVVAVSLNDNRPVDLGSAAHFAILAGAAIAASGGGSIDGDVGLSPASGANLTGFGMVQVSGTVYVVDSTGPLCSVVDTNLLNLARLDLIDAYDDAAGRTNANFVDPGAGNIGGMNLAQGVYRFTTTASISGSDLTLTGGPDDVWIFQIADDLRVDSGLAIKLAGGAQARNVFWQVGHSALLGASSSFKGTLLANQSITMGAGSILEGRALALFGQVTFAGQSIEVPTPASPWFIDISRTASGSAYIVLSTTPYFFLTLKTSPFLSLTNWTIIAAEMPVVTPWIFIDPIAMEAAVTRRYYRAYLDLPPPEWGGPFVDVTNADTQVGYDVVRLDIGGTNNADVTGMMTWTNELTGGGGNVAATGSWTVTGIALGVGANTIRVTALNRCGATFADTVTVIRAGAAPASLLHALDFRSGPRASPAALPGDLGQAGLDLIQERKATE